MAIPTKPGGAEDEISEAEHGPLHPRNDPSFTRNESLYSEDGMERAPDESLYAEDGMYRDQDKSLYAQDGMYFEQDDSLYSEDRPYFGQDWSKFGGKKRVVSAASAC